MALVEDMMRLQPKYGKDLEAGGYSIAKNLGDMADRLVGASQERAGGVPAEARDDALRYFHDVALSLTALVRVYPPAAAALCSESAVSAGSSGGSNGGRDGQILPATGI